jgi:predicted transposase YbfD/YdcC
MASGPLPLLVECLEGIPDPRVARTRLHSLLDILALSISAVVCGAEGWDDIVSFGYGKLTWLKERLGLELPNGIPSADTVRRVFARLDPQALEAAFRAWTKSLHQLTKGEVIALDGKVLRHSFDTACGQNPIHLVSAWASSARLVLGQVKVSEKSNEITAVPLLLDWLEIRGCTVTVDALNTQKAIAAKIIAKEADYALALKENHPALYADVVAHFEHQQKQRFENVAYSTYSEHYKGHGRIETRRCELITLAECDPLWQDVQKEWLGLRSLARITCVRQMPQKTTEEIRYYLCSVPDNAKRVLWTVRKHWGIENRLHYVLDVSLDEDACRIRKDHAPENFGVLRHIALNLLRQETTSQRGIKARQKQAGWDHTYLERVLIAAEN